MDEYQPSTENRLNALDGNVNSQGVKVGHKAWLDMGSKEWGDTPNEIRATAYQAALVTGWCDSAFKDMMLDHYEYMTEAVMDATIEILQELKEEYPLEVIENKKEKE